MASILFAWALGLTVGWGVMFALEPLGFEGDGSQFFSGVVGFAVFVYVIRRTWDMTFPEIVDALILRRRQTRELSEADKDLSDGAYLAMAESEVERGEIDKRLWSKALVDARGDESLRKVEYMKLRAKQIKVDTLQRGAKGKADEPEYFC